MIQIHLTIHIYYAGARISGMCAGWLVLSYHMPYTFVFITVELALAIQYTALAVETLVVDAGCHSCIAIS